MLPAELKGLIYAPQYYQPSNTEIETISTNCHMLIFFIEAR